MNTETNNNFVKFDKTGEPEAKFEGVGKELVRESGDFEAEYTNEIVIKDEYNNIKVTNFLNRK